MSSCESSASSSTIDQENRFVCDISDQIFAFNSTRKSTQPILILDNEDASTGDMGGRVHQLCSMDIDERSFKSASERNFNIDDDSVVGVCTLRSSVNGIEDISEVDNQCQQTQESTEDMAELYNSTDGEQMQVVSPQKHDEEIVDACELDEHSQKSAERGNYVLPALPNDCLPLPASSAYQMVDAKSKRRKLGPLSSELLRRIRAQKSMNTLAKFRAYLIDEKQTSNEALEEFADEKIVASAWGVDMIESSKDVNRFILRKTK